VDVDRIACPKVEFAEAVLAEGIGLNPHYGYLVVDWPWLKPYLADGFETANARDVRDRSFCLYSTRTTVSRKRATASQPW
jgi:hypothetical protein